ncbi:MAG: hypothetical protein AAGB46_04380 [Verrucomicrobiota bacterium]
MNAIQILKTAIATALFLPSVAILAFASELSFPAEGRWSVATGWENEWPTNWRHAHPTNSESVGPWTIHYGEIAYPHGTLKIQDSEKARENGLIEIRRRWYWDSDVPLDRVTLTVRAQIEIEDARPFMPGINYYDNTAGQGVDPTRIPFIPEEVGGKGYYEEHRFPMPLTSVEGTQGDSVVIAALHSLPSPIQYGNHDDQWWSLGLERIAKEKVELALLSGAVASNGKNGVLKTDQRKFLNYPDAYSKLEAHAIVEKTFYLQKPTTCPRGAGFQKTIQASLSLFPIESLEGYTPYKEIIAAKMNDSVARYREAADYAGLKAFPAHRKWIDLGWAGQSEAVAYPFILIGKDFGIENHRRIAQRSLDFITTSPFTENGFSIRFDFGKGEWSDRRNPLSQGQAMNNMFNALRIARREGGYDTRKWEIFLDRSCAHHADRILADDWHPVSTNEGFLIAPLAQGSSLLEKPRYLKAAEKAANHYLDRHLSMDEPYWGGTLDARCEDKEGAWAALQGFLTLYEINGDKRFLKAARHAGDVVLSYMYVWDVPMPPGRLADNNFRSRGWTSVSVQNMHLDVYGVLCGPSFWKLADYTGQEQYRHAAKLLTVPCGQLTDPHGSAGEQLHQTNYAQHYDVLDLKGVRGDYIEEWNVYWISAHFLTAAAQFQEMGVNCFDW